MAPETSNVSEALTANTYSNGSEAFVRWNTSANGSGTNYANGATYAFTSSTTLYAQWAPTFTVTFNANGGTGTMAPETSNVSKALTANTYSNGSLTFLEWATNANGSGTTYANGATYAFTASTTLYAQWTSNTAPMIVQQPTNQEVQIPATASFSASASGTPSPSVQWQVSTNGGVSWSSIVGATSDTYSFEAETTGYEYEAVFTNSVSSVTSSPAQLVGLGYSGNWSGYVLTNSTFSSVSGSWTVPTVSCTSSSHLYASEWVGIDGDNDNYVIQDGTSTDCIGTTPEYSAWYEFFGDPSVNSGDEVGLSTNTYPVSAGNVMFANVAYQSGAWVFTLTNSTRGWSFQTSVAEPSPPPPQSSAEWITEAPELCASTCAVQPLTNFGTVTFTNASAIADGSLTSLIAPSGSAVVDINSASAVLMFPGPLSDQGSSFTVTWQQSS